MPAYVVANFMITDEDKYNEYVQGSIPTLMQHGAKVLVAGGGHKPLEGTLQPITVVLEFESVEAAENWYNSPEYQAVIHLRLEATTNCGSIIAEEFVMPVG